MNGWLGVVAHNPCAGSLQCHAAMVVSINSSNSLLPCMKLNQTTSHVSWSSCRTYVRCPTTLCLAQRMLPQQMQETGQPPAEIIKELAPGLQFTDDGMPMMPNMVSAARGCAWDFADSA